MQNHTELLNQLHDIQLPDPIGWWPLAFSWWILIFSVTSILIGILWYYLDLKRRNVYRVTALAKLDEILQQSMVLNHDKIAQINALLKQVAITAYGRNKTANLYQQDWMNFLSDTSSYIPQPENLPDIMQLAYKGSSGSQEMDSNEALATLVDYARKWIKGHHQ